MKSVLTFLLFITFIAAQTLKAQINTFPSTGSAGAGTTSPDASSLLEIKSDGSVAFGQLETTYGPYSITSGGRFSVAMGVANKTDVEESVAIGFGNYAGGFSASL